MARVKICGITSLAEAQLAEKCGADAVGLLVGQRHKANDFIDRDTARRIFCSLPAFVTTVLVTRLEEAPSMLRAIRERLYPKKIIGMVSVENERAIERVRAIEDLVDNLILDSTVPSTDRVGGTGLAHDWSISAKIVGISKVPVILAGGLTPENVSEAIAVVNPWAVDVNSGVEGQDSRKSEGRIRRFITAAKNSR